MKKRYIIKVSGRVQSVGFRYSANKQAIAMNIKGFVRNEYDGSVYLEAEADEITLNEFVVWCKKGPSWSRVDRVTVEERSLLNYLEFWIER